MTTVERRSVEVPVVGMPVDEDVLGRVPAGSGDLLRSAARLPRSGPADPVHPVLTERLADHLARLGERPRGGPGLVDAIERAGLTGHGGGHVPTALKWRSALRRVGPRTVVANGAESEPVSAKDATLLRQRPHLVLDGLALASETLGARRAVVWLHADDAGSRRALEAALAERRRGRLPGPAIEVVSGPVHYLAGESTAIANALAGGPTLPTSRRPREPDAAPSPRTLVQNVETLARVALIARGCANPQVTLVTVLGAHDRQVLEVTRTARLGDVVAATGVLRAAPPQAVLLGGFGGTWADWADVADLPLDEAAARRRGLSLGAGVIAPLRQGACGVTEAAAIATYLAGMSAQQCGPCLFGLPALASGLQRLALGRAPRRERRRLDEDMGAVAGRGACHHPDGATRMIASAMTVFARDAEAHAHGRPCAGAGHVVLPVPAASRARTGDAR